MIIDQLVEITISNQGKYYLNLGYNNVKQGTLLHVPWQQLPRNSNKKVKARCDECNGEFDRQLQLLMKQDVHLCYYCAKRAIGSKNKNNIVWQDKIKTLRKLQCGENHPRWRNDKDQYNQYKAKVYSITRLQDVTLLENYDKPRGLCGVEGAYQLDHIISIKYGFENNIDPEVIGNLNNIRFIPWEDNRSNWFNNE